MYFYNWQAAVNIIQKHEKALTEIGIPINKVPFKDIVQAVRKFNLKDTEVKKRDGNNIKNRFEWKIINKLNKFYKYYTFQVKFLILKIRN